MRKYTNERFSYSTAVNADFLYTVSFCFFGEKDDWYAEKFNNEQRC
jgi:hypothetical protein